MKTPRFTFLWIKSTVWRDAKHVYTIEEIDRYITNHE